TIFYLCTEELCYVKPMLCMLLDTMYYNIILIIMLCIYLQKKLQMNLLIPLWKIKLKILEINTVMSIYYLLMIYNFKLVKSKHKRNFSIPLIHCMKKINKLLFRVIALLKKFQL